MSSFKSVVLPALCKKPLAVMIAAALTACGSDDSSSSVDNALVSVADIVVPEGNAGQSQAIFTIQLDKAAEGDITVAFDIAAGTATEGIDYQKPDETSVSFAAGESSKTVVVEVVADTAVEPDETFTITLADISGNAVLADKSTATATITNDDSNAVISVADISVDEGHENTSNAVVTVQLDKPAPGRVSVDYVLEDGSAEAGSDYVAADSNITFEAGDSEQTINVEINGDSQFEAAETLLLTLSNASGDAVLGDKTTATITINNDDYTLNDTGVTFAANDTADKDDSCSDETGNNVIAQQDCRSGLDTDDAFNSNDNGQSGFNFTKLDADGNTLAADAASWSCVRDNVTGLVWEVKADSGLRSKDHAYLSYQQRFAAVETPDDISAGVEDTGTGVGSDSCGNDDQICTTEQFATDVNSQALCGFNDWRLPRVNELESILNYSASVPVADADYFPNAVSFWTDTPSRGGASSAQTLYLNGETGLFGLQAKDYDVTADNAPAINVRLVRGGTTALSSGTELTRSVVTDGFSRPNINCDANLGVTTPVADFEFNIDGDPSLVRHKTTGLIWQRCPEGSTFNDAGTAEDYSDDSCAGTDSTPGIPVVAGYVSWDAALAVAAAKGDNWRLPNVRELQSISEHACNLAQNAFVFPPFMAFSQQRYWSSTPALDADGNQTEWYFMGASTERGTAVKAVKSNPAGAGPAFTQPQVRLVRNAD